MTLKRTKKGNTIQSIFKGLSKKLEADFELLSNQLSHSLSKGEAREFVLKELLRQYLPARLGVEKGFVISSISSEASSKQIDIIIYDKLNTPVLYGAENMRIFPVEGVYAVIEVKSYLNENNLRESIENVRSVKAMTKNAFVPPSGPIINHFNLYGKQTQYFPVLGFVFAYTSIIDFSKLKNVIVKSDDMIRLEMNIDSVCVLSSLIIANAFQDKNVVVNKEPNTSRCFVRTSDSLLMFYFLLMHVLPQTSMLPIRIRDYGLGVSLGTLEF